MNEHKEKIVLGAVKLMLDTNYANIMRSLAAAASSAKDNNDDDDIDENRFVNMYNDAKPMYHRIIDIINIVSDNGLIYVSTQEDLRDIWIGLRSEDEHNTKSSTVDWLIQTATTFISTVFEDKESYIAWVDNLVFAYTSHQGISFVEDTRKANQNSITAIDDIVIDKLPRIKAVSVEGEYRTLLLDNAWFVYLLTLQQGLPYLMHQMSKVVRDANG